MGWMEDPTFATAVHFEQQSTNLKGCGITDFGKQTKWGPESGSLSSQNDTAS